MRRLRLLPLLLVAGSIALSPVLGQGPGGDSRGRQPNGFGRRGPTEEEKARARDRVGMTVEQQQKLEQLYVEFDKTMREHMDALRDRFGKLRALYESYDIDTKQAQSIIRDISRLRGRLLSQQLDNEQRVRTILTRDQYARMRALMKEEWEKRAAARRQRGSGREAPPPPGP